jgi:sarcosine oxidase subunit gamma
VFGFSDPTHPIQVGLRVDQLRDKPLLLFELSAEANTWAATGDGREVLWLGPDEWLVVADHGTAGSIVAELDAALDGVHRSVLDLSSNRAAIDVMGRDRLEVLAKGCGLDLDPRSWQPGMCAQTLLAWIPVILQERETGTRVFVRPSYLSYLTAWLDDAAG